MAQDFGDEMGEKLIYLLGDAAKEAWRHYLNSNKQREQAEFHERSLREKGMPQEEAAATAAALSQREQVCIPFGSENDAAYFAQVCRENGTYVRAFAGRDGNGFIQLAADDLDAVQGNVAQFSEVMTLLTGQQIAETLERARPLTEKQVASLTEIKNLPDLPRGQSAKRPASAKEGGVHTSSAQSAIPNHTEHIAKEVFYARSQCRTFEAFQAMLERKGVGITTTKDGEAMFYEARFDEGGQILPFGKDELGRRDWAVGAQTLKKNWGVDATYDSFATETASSRNQGDHTKAIAADGALDTDGATPDLNQGIASHDGMDTDASTLRLERELTGTDIAPSKVRAENDHAFESAVHRSRAASKQLEREGGAAEREMGPSDKLNPVR